MKKTLFAIMAIAAVMAGFSSCKKSESKKNGGESGDDFKSLITVDGTFSDWDNVPATYLVSSTCAASPKWTGLKSVKVYADKVYINVLVEFDESVITDKSYVPFHVYLNADNSDATGGDPGQFADPNSEFMLEGAVFSEGAAASYNPAVFHWGGEVGGVAWAWGDQSVEHSAADNWGADVAEGSGVASSACTGNKIEIAIIREMIPATFADTFGIGFDIQQNWSSAGVLPNASYASDGTQVLANKLKITIDKTERK